LSPHPYSVSRVKTQTLQNVRLYLKSGSVIYI
jgi:hypothetical protein